MTAVAVFPRRFKAGNNINLTGERLNLGHRSIAWSSLPAIAVNGSHVEIRDGMGPFMCSCRIMLRGRPIKPVHQGRTSCSYRLISRMRGSWGRAFVAVYAGPRWPCGIGGQAAENYALESTGNPSAGWL